jgi:predicted nucleic acid-binding protein
MNLLVDSTVLIDALRHRRDREAYLTSLVAAGHGLGITAINVGEIYGGMFPREQAEIDALVARMEVYAISEEIARRGGMLKSNWARQGRTLALDDMLIAAVALEFCIPLLTDNVRDFPMPELKLWPLPRVQ